MDNREIADRLDAFAALLELSEANRYTTRAYRRAAETVRGAAVPVADLVRAGRARELRGIGSGIEARLVELVQTGRIAELEELEHELAPDLVGLGRYLGLSAKRSVQLARALNVRTADELREAAAAGKLRDVPGIGPKIEAQLQAQLARDPESESRPGLLLNRAWELVHAIAAALDGQPAGDPRRFCDSCRQLAVVCSTPDPEPLLDRFAKLPQIVAIVERGERRAVGVTMDGAPVELVAAEPDAFGTELVRATGSPAYVRALEPLPAAGDEEAVYAALGLPWCPPELREEPFRGEPPALLAVGDIRGDLHSHTTWSDGRMSVEEMGRAAAARGYEYLAICDHTPAVGAVRGLTADDVRRQGEEIAAANAVLAPFRDPARDRVRHPARRAARSARRGPRRARMGTGQRPRRTADAGGRDDQARDGGVAQPVRPLPQPPQGALHQPPSGERARPRARVRGRTRAGRCARGQRPPRSPRPERRARP